MLSPVSLSVLFINFICNPAHLGFIEKLDTPTLSAAYCHDVKSVDSNEFRLREVQALMFAELAVGSTIAA